MGKFVDYKETLQIVVLRALSKLYKNLHHLHNPEIHFQCELFDKITKPICDYGCEVWGFHKVPAIERIHLQFCKRFFTC